MPTAWKVSDKSVGGGPTWDSMATDDTDDYDALTEHKWEWTSEWDIFAKISDNSAIEGDLLWGAVTQYWPDYTFVLDTSTWSIFENTKIQGN